MADNRGSAGIEMAIEGHYRGTPDFVFSAQTEAGTASYRLVQAEFPLRVIDAWVVATAAGATGDTVTVQKNGSDAITDAMSVASAGDRDIVRAGELNDANWTLKKGDTLDVATASGAVAKVFVRCVRA